MLAGCVLIAFPAWASATEIIVSLQWPDGDTVDVKLVKSITGIHTWESQTPDVLMSGGGSFPFTVAGQSGKGMGCGVAPCWVIEGFSFDASTGQNGDGHVDSAVDDQKLGSITWVAAKPE